jgi:hypothetical protein
LYLAWKKLFRSLWKNFDSEFGGILKNLERHKGYVEASATVAHYQKYQEDIETLNRTLEVLVDENQRKKSVAVSDWLAVGHQPQTYHEDNLRTREPYPTTAQWIFGNDHIKDILGAGVPATPIIWIKGIPGAGTLRFTLGVIRNLTLDRQNHTLVRYH